MIRFERGHTCIVGMTGTGKTYAARKALEKWHGGVLFVNTMHGDKPRGFMAADGKSNLVTVLSALDAGDKISFNPSRDANLRELQLKVIINVLESEKRKDILIAVDEIHLYRKDAEKALISVATTGRQWGLTLVSITQRLAKLNNDIMTQSPQKVIFSLENEEQYCARYGIPYPEIERRNYAKSPPKEAEPSHGFCIYYAGQVDGAYMV